MVEKLETGSVSSQNSYNIHLISLTLLASLAVSDESTSSFRL